MSTEGARKHEGEEVDLTKKTPIENSEGIIEFIDPLEDTAELPTLEENLRKYDELLKMEHRSQEEEVEFQKLSDALNKWYPGKKKKK